MAYLFEALLSCALNLKRLDCLKGLGNYVKKSKEAPSA